MNKTINTVAKAIEKVSQNNKTQSFEAYAIAAIEALDKWQPIETAPKTSKSIMVYCADRKNTYIVNWGKCNGFLGKDCWKIFGGSSDLSYEEPTHWQPLPEPPKESK